jgi:Undecaprenyl-phosphate glucose phosphotransferase
MYQDRLTGPFRSLPRAGAENRAVWTALMPRRGRAAFRFAISSALALADLLTITVIGFGIEVAYYFAYTGDLLPLKHSLSLQLAALVSTIVLLTNVVREEYSIENYLSQSAHLKRTATLWLVAWATALVIGFATKTTNDFSRIVSVVFFTAGLPAMLAVRMTMVGLVRRSMTPASASVSRIHLVGYEDDIARFYENNESEELGLRVVGTSYLRRPEPGADRETRQALLDEDLELAVSVVRFLRPDDIFVLVPWADTADVERCIDSFLRVPAALHLRPGAMLDRFPELQVARVGRLNGLNIGRRPLTFGEVLLKRCIDLTLASVAMILLAPVFAVVALLIKLDSPGPVLFRQRRYGFNQQAFGVFKFRSMKAEKDAVFKQATRADSRITRVGAILRRTNIDELPQLINVLRGEMSLVGPRPHALAHDRSFERRIALYARRHNVRPGITGWAQVNGFRGETLTDADMEKRVQADLHYIDNWSVWLDLKIMVQTVISPRAYRNAC